jgi:M6 family metalloprotease-like protein
MKKTYFIIGSAICLLGIAGCTAQGGSSALTLSSAGLSSSAAGGSTYVPDVLQKVTLTLTTSTLRKGVTFQGSSGYKVVVSYQRGGDTDITSLSSYTLTITDGDGNAYSATDPLLKVTTYSVKANYRSKMDSDSVSFTVADATAETGKGFSTPVANFDGKDLYTLDKYNKNNSLKTTGNQKILVIPVDFADDRFTDAAVAKIQPAFFGAASDTSWQSLKSFYYESSYHKLTIDGTVSSVFHCDKTSTEMEKMTVADSGMSATNQKLYAKAWNISWWVVEKAVAWYQSQTSSDLKEFDNDGDGYIDGIWMIYNHAYSAGNYWWAWTHHDYGNQNNANVSSPVPYALCWASYNFISQGYYKDGIDIDAHTLIHETGHLLGVMDFYDTDSKTSPIGGVDMMDLNIGDHNPYTKMSYNWITPRVIDYTSDYFSVDLQPFESTGDCLLVHTNSTAKTPTASNKNCNEPNMTEAWNGTPFDEYLLIAYNTPTGLNKLDSTGYPEWAGSTNYGRGAAYDKPGIQVWHVDARLVSATTDHADLPAGQVWIEYTDELIPNTVVYDDDGNMKSGHYCYISTSNTKSRSYWMSPDSENGGEGGNFREITLVSSDASTAYLSGHYGTRMGVAANNLFAPDGNYGFSKEKFAGFFPGYDGRTEKTICFDDGTSIDYNFVVTSLADDKASLLFAKA